MPTYCFRNKDGEVYEKVFSMADAPEFIMIKGKKAYRDLRAEHGHVAATPGNYPFTSVFAGVHPDDVPGMRKINEAGGVPTDYNKDGDPTFRSKGHRKKYFALHKLYDRNAGYSDQAPVNK